MTEEPDTTEDVARDAVKLKARISALQAALKPFADAWAKHDPKNPLSAPHGSIQSEAFENAARVLKDAGYIITSVVKVTTADIIRGVHKPNVTWQDTGEYLADVAEYFRSLGLPIELVDE